jgi:hypothetical protein
LFVPNRDFPTIVMEVGYSETYDDLRQDALLHLEGSAGEIGTVILIKIVPLKFNERNIKSAFLQVYRFDPVKQKGVLKGGQMVSSICLLYLLWADYFLRCCFLRPSPMQHRSSFSHGMIF